MLNLYTKNYTFITFAPRTQISPGSLRGASEPSSAIRRISWEERRAPTLPYLRSCQEGGTMRIAGDVSVRPYAGECTCFRTLGCEQSARLEVTLKNGDICTTLEHSIMVGTRKGCTQRSGSGDRHSQAADIILVDS
jgi:hypothetical protein